MTVLITGATGFVGSAVLRHLVAAAAGAKCLVLNHFVPVRFDRAALLAEVARDYAGPIVIGEDLMSLDVATARVRAAGYPTS